jgi:type II secretion system protein J
MKHLKGQSGFTLIEVVVSVGILATMSVLISSTMTNVIHLKVLAEHRAELRHVLTVTMAKLADDLGMAFLADVSLQGKEAYYLTSFIGEENKLNFSTMSNIHYVKNGKDTDQVRVAYELSKNADGGEDLTRRQTDHLVDNPDKGGRRFILLKNVKAFTLQYYDSNKKEWQPRWDNDSISYAGRLPRMVKVNLTVVDQEDDENEESVREYVSEVVLPVPLYKDKLNF